MNTIQLLLEPSSCYCKPPKKATGGCAIWDLAAVVLLLQEANGTASSFDGAPLSLNRSSTVYFNDVGLIFASSDVVHSELLELMTELCSADA